MHPMPNPAPASQRTQAEAPLPWLESCRRGRSSPSSTATSSARRTRRRRSPSRSGIGGAGAGARRHPRRDLAEQHHPDRADRRRQDRDRAPSRQAARRAVHQGRGVEVHRGRATSAATSRAMVRDLVDGAINMVRTEREDEVGSRRRSNGSTSGCSTCCCLPAPAPRRPGGQVGRNRSGGPVFVVGSSGQVKAERASTATTIGGSRSAREAARLLVDGQLDDREVEIEVTPQGFP